MRPTGIYPRRGPRPTESHGEERFYHALRDGLPPGWVAWHSLRLRDHTRESECDFVIAVPEAGVILVEVKGGHIEVRDGVWRQNRRRMEQEPRQQAHRFKSLLLAVLGQRLRESVPWLAIVTAFPDTAWDVGPGQHDVRGAVLGAGDLPDLGHRLRALVPELFGDRPEPESDRFLEELHALWGEQWLPEVGLEARADAAERELCRADAAQRALLDMLEDNRRLLVRGAAGTGKTILALERHRRSLAAGKQSFLLCWTEGLAAALRRAGDPRADTVRHLARDFLDKAGRPHGGERGAERWTAEDWRTVCTEAARLLRRVNGGEAVADAVVIDEAQVFSAEDWDFVRALVGDTGELHAFGDEAQAFWRDRVIPDELFPARFRLRRGYRCPSQVLDLADDCARRSRGETPRLRRPEDESDLAALRIHVGDADEAALARLLREALAAGMGPRDLAVVSLGGQSRTRLTGTGALGDLPTRVADAPDLGDYILADTFLRVLGLERPVVFVVELSLGRGAADGDAGYFTRLHLALTRANVSVTVLATHEELAQDPVLAAWHAGQRALELQRTA